MITTSSEVVARIVQRTIELVQTPAPTFAEQARAQLIAGWWRELGVQSLASDEVGNVVGRIRSGGRAGNGPTVLVCAHLDTVFGADVTHAVERRGDLLIGPSVGDDSVALAALTELGSLLPEALPADVWIAATVGEEGLGNLRGVTHLLDSPPAVVDAFIALEGNYLGRINTVGVGSARFRILVEAPGGHSWEEAHHSSAVESSAVLIAALRSAMDDVIALSDRKATMNIGTIVGGESVNSRAQMCEFTVDLRAESPETLEGMAKLVDRAVAELPSDLETHVTTLGLRPAGRVAADHPLVMSALRASQSHGLESVHTAASTDANAAYVRGIPAVTLGVARGGDTHTEREWIDASSISLGMSILVDTIVEYINWEDAPCKPE